MLGFSMRIPRVSKAAASLGQWKRLGLLPVRIAVMREEKTVRVAAGQSRGYEIHMGETSGSSENGRVRGTYVHGLFDDDGYRHTFLDVAREECGLAPAREKVTGDGESTGRASTGGRTICGGR